ncbi:hypothetical protein HDU85_007163 [Gaertneriomyces sp. JEL0708]|nr:hypothetical protein HDU85_007163 [Gaertneriomyces sp. JEL0708]
MGGSGIIRYSRKQLLQLQESPLVERPDGLPDIAELLNNNGPPRNGNPKDWKNDSHEPNKSRRRSDANIEKGEDGEVVGVQRAPARTTDRNIVFGPPKMSFASSRANKTDPDADVVKESRQNETLRQPKYSVAERMASKQGGFKFANSTTDEAESKAPFTHPDRERPAYKPGPRDQQKPSAPIATIDGRNRKDERGSWRERTEGTASRPLSGKSGNDIRPAVYNQRRNRDSQPEWMTDTGPLKFDGSSSATGVDVDSSAGEDDIQRFKAQMRMQEAARLGLQPAAPSSMGGRSNRTEPFQAGSHQPNASENLVGDQVDAFLSGQMKLNKLDDLFFDPKLSNPVPSPGEASMTKTTGSKFAKFWNQASDAAPALAGTEGHVNEPPGPMLRIGVSELFGSVTAAGSGFQLNATKSTNVRNFMGDAFVDEQQYMTRQGVDPAAATHPARTSSRHSNDLTMRPPPSAPAAPSEEDRAGITKVMEKLAFFGIGRGGAVPEPHLTNRAQGGEQPSMENLYEKRQIGLPLDAFNRQPEQPGHAPRGVSGESRSESPSLYQSTMNSCLPDDPSTQLSAMIQAASKAKKNHNPIHSERFMSSKYPSGPHETVDGEPGFQQNPLIYGPGRPFIPIEPQFRMPLDNNGPVIRSGLNVEGPQFVPGRPPPFVPPPHVFPQLPGPGPHFPPQHLVPGMYPPPPFAVHGVPVRPFPAFMGAPGPLPPADESILRHTQLR